MNHLTKEELEKLKVGDELRVSCFTNPFNDSITFETATTTYIIKILKIKLGRNGYRFRTHLLKPPTKDFLFPEIHNIDIVILNFTINGSFSNSGIHNPGKNYLRRKYFKI